MRLDFDKRDRDSELWKRITEAVHEEIDLLRRRNDGPINEAATLTIRGRIAALKDLLASAKDVMPTD